MSTIVGTLSAVLVDHQPAGWRGGHAHYIRCSCGLDVAGGHVGMRAHVVSLIMNECVALAASPEPATRSGMRQFIASLCRASGLDVRERGCTCSAGLSGAHKPPCRLSAARVGRREGERPR